MGKDLESTVDVARGDAPSTTSNNLKKRPANEDEGDDDNLPTLSPYAQLRADKIKNNNALLVSLGLMTKREEAISNLRANGVRVPDDNEGSKKKAVKVSSRKCVRAQRGPDSPLTATILESQNRRTPRRKEVPPPPREGSVRRARFPPPGHAGVDSGGARRAHSGVS